MVDVTYQMVLSTIQTIGLLVAIIYYITIMRNAQRTRELTLEAQEHTLETRQSQLFMNIYNLSFGNPVFLKEVKIVHQKSPDINSANDFSRAYDYMNPNPEDPKFQDAWNYVSSFYEGLGVFIKEGLIDIRLIALTMTGMTQSTWNIIAPYVDELRKSYGTPRWVGEWEYLINELDRYIEEHPELKAVDEKTDFSFSPKQE